MNAAAIIEELRWAEDGLQVTVNYKGLTKIPPELEALLSKRETHVRIVEHD